MRIDFQRSGGFAGLKLRLSLDVNTLPDEQAKAIRRMIDEANFLTIDEVLPGAPNVRDEYQYQITVITENIQHSIQAAESSMPESLRPFVEELTRLAREQRRR